MKNKKIIVISLSVLLVVILIVAFTGKDVLQAFYTSKDKLINNFTVGKIQASIVEPSYVDKQILKPGDEITKDPKLSNSGEIDCYLRAQVYVPMTKDLKYVDSNESVITPSEEIEVISYEVNSGWEQVIEDGFSGVVKDSKENKYKVYTYKYVENGEEKIVKPGEQIEDTVFDKIKIINYLDADKDTNFKVTVKAIAVQTQEGKTANEMWTYYKNQNGTGIGEVN